MQFIVEIYARILGLLYAFALPIVALGVPALVIGSLVYVLAGPAMRSRMVGWGPGVAYGVTKTLGLARALQDRRPGEAQ